MGVVKANLDDVGTLTRVFAGAQVIFAITTVHDRAIELEVAHGNNGAKSTSSMVTPAFRLVYSTFRFSRFLLRRYPFPMRTARRK